MIKINDQYKTIDQYKNEITQDKLIIIHINIRSLQKKFDTFKTLINNIKKEPHVICLTETWLNDLNNTNLELLNYTMEYKNRTNNTKKSGGGVCIYIHKSIEYKISNDLTFNINDYLEILSIEIKLNLSNKLLLSTLYNSPFHRQIDFLNILYEQFHTHINDNIILLGDFNNDTNTSTTPLNLLTTQLGLKPTITQTIDQYLHNTSANTIIDQIYINPNYHPSTISGILLEDITDHLPIYILIAKNKNNQKQTDTVTTRRLT